MGKKQKEQVVKQQPWAPGAAAAQDFLGQAQGLMNSGGMYSPETQQAQQMSLGQVNDPNSMLNTGLNQFQQTMQGRDPSTPLMGQSFGNTDVMNNPALQSMMDRAMSSADSQFSQAGRSGSGLHAFNRMELAAPYMFDQYNRERGFEANDLQQRRALEAQMTGMERGFQESAINRAPGMSQAGAGIMGQVGAQRDPMQTLQNYGGLIQPFAGMGQQQSSPMYRNQGAGALGGAATGAGLYGMLGSGGIGAAGASGIGTSAGLGSAGMMAGIAPWMLGGAVLGGLL